METPGHGREITSSEIMQALDSVFSSPVPVEQDHSRNEVGDENEIEQERLKDQIEPGHEQVAEVQETNGGAANEHEQVLLQEQQEKASEAGNEARGADAGNGFEISLPRKLSSPDRAVREKALTVLGEWLASCKQVEEQQLVPIWRGLLFRVWQTSKGPAQVELNKSIALFLGSLSPEMALIAFKVFLSIMVKEWSGIDRTRVDKFRSLLQLCLRKMLSLLEIQSWNEELTRKFVEALGATEGVNVSLLQAYLEELRSFVPPTTDVLRLLLEPFFLLSVNCSSKLVLQKIRDAVFLPLLQEARAALRKQSEGQEQQQQERSLGSLVLALSMGNKFSELSASPSVAPNNKKLLQQLYENFTKFEKAPPLLGLKAVKKPEEEAQQLPGENVSFRKRKRVNAGESSPEHRRVLRSEKRMMLQKQLEWEDPVVLNLEEKLSLLGNPRSEDDAKGETTSSSGGGGGNEDESDAEQQQRAAKRVRFSLSNNVVWSPHRPMPPQWVRVPPCAAPRGSAMKAGVLPGPISEAGPMSEASPTKEKREEKKKRKRKKASSKASNSSKRKKGGGGGGGASPGRSKRVKTG